MPLLPNPKHEKIVQAYVKGKGQLEAYIVAGFKPHAQNASTFFKRSEVQERIKEVRELRSKIALERDNETSAEAARKLGITKQKILEALWINAANCLRTYPITDEDGKPTGRFTAPVNPSAGNQALKLVGMETHNMFIEKMEVGGPGDFGRLTDDELFARVEEDAAALGLSSEATEALLLSFQKDEGDKE